MKYFISLAFAILSLSFLSAQNGGWENITNTKMVTCLLNDADTLWIGTFGGLVKFNKHSGESQLYTKASSGLPSNCILGLVKDNRQNLWISSRFNGIGCLKNDSCIIFSKYNTSMLYDEYCQGIYVDNLDTLYFGTLKQFIRIKNNQLKIIEIGNPIVSKPEYITEIVLSKTGALILATTFGLFKYDGGSFTLIDNFTSDCKAAITDLSGNVWIATSSKGIYKYDGISLENYNIKVPSLPAGAQDMSLDKSGNIWLAGDSIYQFNGITCTGYKKPVTDFILSIACDDTCIWVGTRDNGLLRFSNNTYNRVKISGTEIPSNSNGIIPKIDSTILLRSFSRITGYNGHTFTTLADTSNGLITFPVKFTVPLKNKGFFLAGDTTKLCFYENGTFRYYDHFENDYLRSIAPLSPDTFWVATSNRGLIKYQNGQLTEFNVGNSPLPNNNLYALAFDKKGKLWGSFGYSTTNPGIFSFDGSNWQIWTASQVPFLNYIATSLVFDTKNNLWCNSINNSNMSSCRGLIRYDGINWSLYNTTNTPLPTNTILSVFSDTHDTIWLATTAGAAKFDRENFWKIYTIYNSGLAFISVNDIVRIPNGKVYFSHPYGGLSVLYSNSNNSTNIKKNNKDKTSLKYFIIYPNPSDNIIKLRFNIQSKFIIMVNSISGKELISEKVMNISDQNEYTLNIKSLPNGIYLITIINDTGKYSQKFIKK